MKVVRILGGLGNQLFQYAFSRELERRAEEPVFTDTSAFDRYRLHNGLELERVFGLSLQRIKVQTARQLCTEPTNPLTRARRRFFPKKSHFIDRDTSYHGDVFTLAGDRYYEGYWQSERYFEGVAAELRRDLVFPALSPRNEDFLAGLPRPACAVHVRRGDYLRPENTHLAVCGLDYYRRAIAELAPSSASLVVFSDDPAWCREWLVFEGSSLRIVDWNRGAESWQDLALMAACEHHVIANSSFSWWGAWLGEAAGGRVLAPALWARAGRGAWGYRLGYADIVPPRWTRMAVE